MEFIDVELNSRTRGFSEALIINQAGMFIKKTERGIVSTSDHILSDNDRKIIQKILHNISIESIESLQPPSKEHASDKAMITTLIIRSINGSSVTSPMFDKGNPPEEIKKLVDHIERIARKLQEEN